MIDKFTVDTEVKVSTCEAVVGMAVYKGDRVDWVQQAIESVLSQLYTDFVFAIVFDGEVGGEIESLVRDTLFKHRNVALIRSSENRGLSACMNYVVEWSKRLAPLFFFRMDADDIACENRLLVQTKFLKSNPSVSILGSALDEINEQGNVVGQRKLPLSHEEIIKFLPKRCSLNHPTVGLRFSVFDAGFRYSEKLANTQDYFLWADLAAAGYKFTNLSEKLLKFRRVNNFYKRRGINKSINEFKARWYTMKKLNQFTVANIMYACAVICLRMMPSQIIKIAYTFDRYLLEKIVKH
ncbi:glycosyltransferase [Neptunicella marina]|uniref:Glycosyltransferase n=1 Tax=Neptunicella marina TaxID=2125989 RepID=A0A8J6M0K7_9ALTE|nr:glycosyltransferase [Neptunicella marina]MBC3764918.1 glycosyltransferase [Neptunicella marina]